MSENKSLIQQLSHCEKYEFDEVVKSYLKEIYKLTNIVFTDTPIRDNRVFNTI